jgi:hypothetical protein
MMMIDWKQLSTPEIIEKWNTFLHHRKYEMDQAHPAFICINDREWLIFELLNRLHMLLGKSTKRSKTKNVRKSVMRRS